MGESKSNFDKLGMLEKAAVRWGAEVLLTSQPKCEDVGKEYDGKTVEDFLRRTQEQIASDKAYLKVTVEKYREKNKNLSPDPYGEDTLHNISLIASRCPLPPINKGSGDKQK